MTGHIRPPGNIYSRRLSITKESFRKRGVEGFLVTDIHNVRYLSGFSGSSGFLFITRKENIFATDFRYKEQSEKEVEGWEILIEKGDGVKLIKSLCQKNDIKKLGIESSVSYIFFNKLCKTGLYVHPFEGLIEKFRETKDVSEITAIKEAIRRAENAFIEVKPYIRAGAREISIALRLEEKLKKKRCRHIPFDIIVASGTNSAMPHAKPTEKKLSPGDLVIIDWGGEADGYFSDMTRTLLMKGDNLNKKKEIYQIVLEANKSAISKIKPKTKSPEIDSYAREVINKAGYGNFFGHGTGHGVGLQVHEAPRITWNKREIIRENMVFTIEPGIYIPGLGGVRIEDIVAVRQEKCEVLTSLPKNLEVI
ncbi:MAG: aminopeptidase P family protein [Nitrospirae bacterium]|jgi:Xaa-Pro aminopeptidase|nr:aminopeptidase P family protein [Nitrospirota bacterium]